MESAANIIPIQDRAYLRENWKRVLAESQNESYRYVRILKGVATITNGEVLLRCPVALPDGFYVIGAGNELKSIEHFGLNPKQAYPDVDCCCPKFEHMVRSQEVPSHVISQLCVWLEYARREQSMIVVNRNGFAMNSFAAALPDQYPDIAQAHPEMLEKVTFDFRRHLGFQLPIAGEGVVFSAQNLKLAFMELSRYPSCFISRDEGELAKGGAPLFLGYDWGRCALVMPVTRW